MIINHNITALNTHRQLGAANKAQSGNMEKLSSGLRINRAGDDAAGLSISEKMRGQIRGLTQASRNAQDGISLIQTAEGALQETHAILQRMRELAVQSSSDTNVDTLDREAIQNEFEQLKLEIDRIGNDTEFNTQKLLNGGGQIKGAIGNITNVTSTAGSGTDAAASLTVGGANGFKVTATSNGTAGNDYTVTIVQGSGNNVPTAGVVDANGNLTITLGTDGSGAPLAVKGSDIAALTLTGAGASLITITTEGDGSGAISAQASTNLAGGSSATPGTPGSTTFSITTALGAGDTITVAGETITVYEDNAALAAAEDAFGISLESAATADAQAAAIRDMTFAGRTLSGTGSQVVITQSVAGTGDVTGPVLGSANAGSGFSATFQIGANQSQIMEITIDDMRADALQLTNVSLATGADAREAITTINNAINKVSTQRSYLGAYQNRLEHTIKNLDNSAENLQAAESRIRDVDMAKEIMEQTKNAILAQAAQAMLAQANQKPQGVLQLLQ